MSLESITAIADQQTQNLLAVSGAIGSGQANFAANAINQQITDLLENPSDPTELLGYIGAASAATRGAQPPIMPPVATS